MNELLRQVYSARITVMARLNAPFLYLKALRSADEVQLRHTKDSGF